MTSVSRQVAFAGPLGLRQASKPCDRNSSATNRYIFIEVEANEERRDRSPEAGMDLVVGDALTCNILVAMALRWSW
ncbi:MAG: hypothetical protein IPP12_17870 [Nitrospira sp.]|nr:hypothetical protein [Nitrospira sp.]